MILSNCYLKDKDIIPTYTKPFDIICNFSDLALQKRPSSYQNLTNCPPWLGSRAPSNKLCSGVPPGLEKTLSGKIDLYKLAFMKDDAERMPYSLVDEFDFGIITLARSQKYLLPEESLRALKEQQEKRFHPPRVQTLLKTAKKLQNILDTQQGVCRRKLADELDVSKARITQILNLLNFAPEIQDYILSMPPVDGRAPISERALRPLTLITNHKKQIKAFKKLINKNHT